MCISREKTKDEIIDEFLKQIKGLIPYWLNIDTIGVDEKLEGLAFSILSMLDGCTGMPKFIVAPDPHPDDKEYYTSNEENYYPENYDSNVKCDISGGLHELFVKK